jgi:ribosomal protein S18 acetylase RimI-like enzyme
VTDPLDNPVLASLAGPHAGLALTRGRAARYPADVVPFCALPGEPDAADWADMAGLLGPGEKLLFPALRATPPAGWEVLGLGEGVQLVATTLDVAPDEEAVPLGSADVPDMLSLTRRSEPGPFRSRTIELGAYLGIRRDGQLVAMAGERMRAPGWTEISAVCTDPAWRGQGLASRLTRAVAAGIAARGETPFLHAIATNTTAIRLYTKLGFTRRRDIQFPLLRRSELAGSGEQAGSGSWIATNSGASSRWPGHRPGADEWFAG